MKKQIKVLMLSGKATSGKSHLARHIASNRGGIVAVISFAAAIKEWGQDAIYHFEGQPKEVIRPIYQAIGAVGRSIDKDFWIKIAMEHIRLTSDYHNPSEVLFIIDDCRFPNEVDLIKSSFGDVKVLRLEGEYRAATNDVSETALDDYEGFDFIGKARDAENNYNLLKEWLTK